MDRGAWWAIVMGSQRVGHDCVTNTHTQILSAVLGPSKGNEQKKALAMRTSHSSKQTEKSILSGGKFHEKKKKNREK